MLLAWLPRLRGHLWKEEGRPAPGRAADGASLAGHAEEQNAVGTRPGLMGTSCLGRREATAPSACAEWWWSPSLPLWDLLSLMLLREPKKWSISSLLSPLFHTFP